MLFSLQYLMFCSKCNWFNTHFPKRNSGTLDSNAAANTAATTTTKAIIANPETLKIAEGLIQILQDYVKLKRQEMAAVKF
jgi:hypothetical protein